jgi:uncharacterized protein (DUF305 family)
MTAEEAVDPTAEGTDEAGATRPWHRVLVVVGGALAMFLLGAAAGLFIGLPGTAPPAPAADSVDVGFAQDMTVHHEQAVLMASWARDHSTDPVVRQLAFDIESTQIAQIGRMQGWLALWGRAPLPTGGHMAWMTGPAADHHGQGASDGGGVATMPGMATAEELRALREATGTELDVLFLQLMLRHHEGGAGMLADAAEHASVPDVRNLSSQMLAAQSNESVYLRTLLAERGAAPLPPP